MITIDNDAAEYIKKHRSSVVIEMKFEPAIGGCVCSGKIPTGSYVPFIYLDEPLQAERDKYHIAEINSITVYYPANLRVKEGHSQIRIRLKKIVFMAWLEIEGAMAVTMGNYK